MKTRLRYSLLTLAGAVLLTGCMPRVPAPRLPDRNETIQRTMWEDTSTIERNYSLKPEPYSLDSDQKDPELLGPQSTIKKSLASSEMVESSSLHRPEPKPQFVAKDETEKPAAPAMTRSHCIELIGQADYDKYTRQFGSEQAALRKCIILERVQKR